MRWKCYLNEDGEAAWAWRQVAGDPWKCFAGTPWQPQEALDTLVPEEALAPARTLPVVPFPPAILCIGLNYLDHMKEVGATQPRFPMLFMKNPSTVTGSGCPVILPRYQRSDKVDFEGELAVVIGKPARNVSLENALNHVAGYTCANDISARDWQKEWGGGQFCKGKSFDTFCPLGPELVAPDEIPDPNSLAIRTVLNQRVVQEGLTAEMIFSVAEIISFLSGDTTLLPGTVILTGTPAGVGAGRTPPLWLQDGDEVRVEIEGIGTLENKVRAGEAV